MKFHFRAESCSSCCAAQRDWEGVGEGEAGAGEAEMRLEGGTEEAEA